MVQASHESVDQLAFRFKNILYQLEKMGENLAEQCPNYVVSQFVSKAQAQLTLHLTMRASEFQSLDAVDCEQSLFSLLSSSSREKTSRTPARGNELKRKNRDCSHSTHRVTDD